MCCQYNISVISIYNIIVYPLCCLYSSRLSPRYSCLFLLLSIQLQTISKVQLFIPLAVYIASDYFQGLVVYPLAVYIALGYLQGIVVSSPCCLYSSRLSPRYSCLFLLLSIQLQAIPRYSCLSPLLFIQLQATPKVQLFIPLLSIQLQAISKVQLFIPLAVYIAPGYLQGIIVYHPPPPVLSIQLQAISKVQLFIPLAVYIASGYLQSIVVYSPCYLYSKVLQTAENRL